MHTSQAASRYMRGYTHEGPRPMAVYVDNIQIPWRGMIMSHMTADSLDELHSFAAALSMKRAWFQDKSVPHYDVSEGKRQQAIRMGAVEEDWRSSLAIERHRRWRRRTRAAERGCRYYTSTKQHYREKRANA